MHVGVSLASLESKKSDAMGREYRSVFGSVGRFYVQRCSYWGENVDRCIESLGPQRMLVELYATQHVESNRYDVSLTVNGFSVFDVSII